MLQRLLLLPFLVLVLLPRAAAAQQTGADLRLRPGDVVRLEVGREPQMNGEYRVGEDGRVLLPLVGFVAVAGLPFGDAIHAIRNAYAVELADPAVAVTPVLRIAVLGEVRQPGLVPVEPSLTLADVVASAGGLTPDGAPDDIQLVREGETLRLSLLDRSAAEMGLHSGDQVVVGRRSWFSRNTPVLISASASVAAAVLTALILR